MKIAVAQINTRTGDFDYNAQKVVEAIRWAKKRSADVVAFPNDVLSGCPLGDLPFYRDFLEKQYQTLRAIADVSSDIKTIVGYAFHDEEKIAVLHNGMIDYANAFSVGAHQISVIPTSEPQRFNENDDISLQLGASTFYYQGIENRKKAFQSVSGDCHIFINRVGGETGTVFDGGSLIAAGGVLHVLPYFEEAYAMVDAEDCSVNIYPFRSYNALELCDKMSFIHRALMVGIRDFFEKQSFQKCVVGLSGGIDSAVVAALASEALGAENVWGILLPSHFSSDHSVKDAVDLAQNLGCKYDIIPIKTSYEAIYQSLTPVFQDLPAGVAEENIQARIRGTIIMALSNKFGHIMLNTSNKSEIAVGYGTLYGDSCGALSVMGDLYKTEVFELAHFINREKEIIPVNTIKKPPSAELRPDQKDSDSLPPYDILDAILYAHIEERLDAPEIIERGFDPGLTAKILKMVASNEYKRKQAAPVIQLSSRSFGHHRSIPLSSLWNRKG